MIQHHPTDLYWYMICIDDKPRWLSGDSILKMLKLITEVEEIKFIIFEYVDAIGKNEIFNFLHENVDEVFEIEKFLQIAKDIEHVERGDFFLFKEYPKDWENSEDEPYPLVIAQADTTFKCVDDRYMYLYTQNDQLFELVRSKYEIESFKIDILENLDFPY